MNNSYFIDTSLLVLLGSFNILLNLCSAFISDKYNYFFIFLPLKIICSFTSALLIYFRKQFTIKKFKYFLLTSLLIYQILELLEYSYNTENTLLVPRLSLFLKILILNDLNFFSFIDKVIISLFYFFNDCLLLIILENERHFIIVLLEITIVFWSIAFSYIRASMNIHYFNKSRLNSFEKNRLNQLVMHLLPHHVKLNN